MGKTLKKWKEQSRVEWGTVYEDGEFLTAEKIQIGAIMRIADACELMAKRYTDLIDERDRYKHRLQERDSQIEKLNNEARTLRGVVTRFRNERDNLRKELTDANSQLSTLNSQLK